MAIFEAKNVTQRYDDVTIIEDINISVEKGETVCLIGSSGVGKSTLFQVLSGLKKPVEGHVYMEGKEITGEAGKISYMLQKDMLFQFNTIIDNVSLPYRIKPVRWKDTEGLPFNKRLEKKFLKRTEARKKVAPYFKQFGLDGVEKKYPNQLSGGMRQRAAFMRTYFMDNPVMLLDEPFSALDEITKTGMYSWFTNISKELNLTTLFISHSLDEAITLSDRILVMSGKPGKIIKEIKINKDTEGDFSTSAEYMAYKKELKELLNR